jgi:hypothetical protein
MSLYQRYRRLRVEAGFDDDFGLIAEHVWNGCDQKAQESMVAQMQAAVDRRNKELERFGGDHW